MRPHLAADPEHAQMRALWFTPGALYVLCLLLTVSAPQKREPKWASDWDAGLAEARERKCPIIVVAPFKRGTHKPCIFPIIFNDLDVIRVCDRFVCFLADDARYSTVDTVYAAKYVKPAFGKYGSLQVVFCKPDGTEIEKLRLKDSIPKGKLLENMNMMLVSYPSVISKSAYDSCKKLAQGAELMRSLGAYTQAIKAYEKLAKKKVDIQLVKDAGTKPEMLKKEAAQKVEEAAKSLAEGNEEEKREALERLHVYNRGMKKLKLHSKVKDLLARTKKETSLKTAYNRAQKAGRAFELFVRAENACLASDYRKAMKTYRRIVRTYDETVYYDKAKKRIREIVEKFAAKKVTTTP